MFSVKKNRDRVLVIFSPPGERNALARACRDIISSVGEMLPLGLFNFLEGKTEAWLLRGKQSSDVSAKLHRVLVVHPSVRLCPAPRAGSSPRKTAARAARVTSDVRHQSQTRHTFLGSPRAASRAPAFPLPRALHPQTARNPSVHPSIEAAYARDASPIGELHGKDRWIPNKRGSLSRILKYRAYFSIVFLQSVP